MEQSPEPENDAALDPALVVQELIDAVNARDVDRIAECFSRDAVMTDEPGIAFAQGRDAIRAHFNRFLSQSPDLHGHIASRICVRPWVVQEEICSGLVLEEPIPEFHIAVAYRVENGKIVKSIGLQ